MNYSDDEIIQANLDIQKTPNIKKNLKYFKLNYKNLKSVWIRHMHRELLNNKIKNRRKKIYNC